MSNVAEPKFRPLLSASEINHLLWALEETEKQIATKQGAAIRKKLALFMLKVDSGLTGAAYRPAMARSNVEAAEDLELTEEEKTAWMSAELERQLAAAGLATTGNNNPQSNPQSSASISVPVPVPVPVPVTNPINCLEDSLAAALAK